MRTAGFQRGVLARYAKAIKRTWSDEIERLQHWSPRDAEMLKPLKRALVRIGYGAETDRARVAEALFRVRDELGVRTLVVSHDLDGLGGWAEEIVVLERGAVVARGGPAELLEVDPEAVRLRR